MFNLTSFKELGLPFLSVASTELVAGISGESEEKIRSLFSLALENAPCILLLDEIDAIAPKRESTTREMEKRIVSQLISCLDGTCAYYLFTLVSWKRNQIENYLNYRFI